MERENILKTLSLIEDFEQKNVKIDEILSNLPISSRNELLQEITRDIIEQNSIIKEHGFANENTCDPESQTQESSSINLLIDNLVSNIQKNPSKKVLYLRLFLERFRDISDQDKNVVIQSIKDEDSKGLKEKILSILKVFKLEG
jgi:metal-responsive CopG/Arc/MetJ family transcriptional regulator